MRKTFFTVGELASISGLSKQTLQFYDKKDLLKPAYVDPSNGYRYYRASQLDLLDYITMLQESGLSLSEIRTFLNHRTPEQAIALLQTQSAVIRQKIKHLQSIEHHLKLKLQSMQLPDPASDPLSFHFHEKESFLLAEAVDIPEPYHPETALQAQDLAMKQLIIRTRRQNYPYLHQQGAIIPVSNLISGEYLKASHMFLPADPYKNKIPRNALTAKPAGFYAHYYFTGNYLSTGTAYRFLLNILQSKGLTPLASAYEYIIIDSFASRTPEQYLIQIQIPLRFPDIEKAL